MAWRGSGVSVSGLGLELHASSDLIGQLDATFNTAWYKVRVPVVSPLPPDNSRLLISHHVHLVCFKSSSQVETLLCPFSTVLSHIFF